MSDEVNPVPSEERESSSGLLLSVEPLHEDTQLYATETNDPSDDAEDADQGTTDPANTDSDGSVPDEADPAPDHPPPGEAPGGAGGKPGDGSS